MALLLLLLYKTLKEKKSFKVEKRPNKNATGNTVTIGSYHTTSKQQHAVLESFLYFICTNVIGCTSLFLSNSNTNWFLPCFITPH